MEPSKIIDALGGTAQVSRLCEVEMAAVSQWRHDGIPNARLMFLRLARPKVFKALDDENGESKRSPRARRKASPDTS